MTLDITHEMAEQVLTEHAADVGHIAIAWNNLHDELAVLFANVISPHEQLGLAAWNAINSDHAQRLMLEAVLREAFESDDPFLREMKWVLGKITGLSDDRNNALHATYSFIIEEGRLKVWPEHFNGNRRAKNLEGRDLALELRSYRARIEALSGYTNDLHIYLCHRNKGEPLPDRPSLPRPPQAMTQKAQNQ